MDSSHNTPASSTSLSTQDWNLLFGSVPKDPVFRGAARNYADEDIGIGIQKQTFPTKILEQTEDRRHPQNIQEVDPMFLTRFVMFATQVAIPTVFQFVLDFVQDHEKTSGNFVSDRLNAMIRGGLFDETRYVEYQVSMFTFEGRLGLSLEVVDGYAPAVQCFWKELTRTLSQNAYTEAQDEESDSEEFDFFDSDEENDMPFLDLEEAKFLSLGESPELVNQWFEDLSNPNFMQQTLLLLAWNCQNEQNFEAVTGDNQAQQLFDTIIACMIATAADFCLPIARCASMLVGQLVESHDIEVSDDQFQVLVKTLVDWSIANQNERDQSKLTCSKEVASILSSQISKEKMAPLAMNCKDTLERVYTQAPYDCVRNNLHKVVRAY